VRIPTVFLTLLFVLPCRAQIPDTGNQEDTGMPPGPGEAAQAYPVAQPAPAVAQQAEAEREKLLKAADQIDLLQSNSELTKAEVDSMKNDIAQLQASNADLKQQLAALQAALDKAEAERAKERQVLVDEVASLVASRAGDTPKPVKHHHADDADSPDSSSTEVHGKPVADDGSSSSSTHATSPDDSSLTPPPDPAPAPKPQKGYYHTVESGETLTMICQAYRDQGVKVSVSQVRKANGLSSGSVLKVGQRLFIPQPGT
jgi:LysM repeat protein